MQRKLFTIMSEQQQLLQNETTDEMVLLSDQMVFSLLGQVDDFLTWVPPAAAWWIFTSPPLLGMWQWW